MATDAERVTAVIDNLTSSGKINTSIPGAVADATSTWSEIVPGLMIGDGGGSEPVAWGLLRYRRQSFGEDSVQVIAGRGIFDVTIRPNGVRFVVSGIASGQQIKHISITPQELSPNAMMICDVLAISPLPADEHRVDVRYLGATLTGTGSQTFAEVPVPPNAALSGTLGYIRVAVW